MTRDHPTATDQLFGAIDPEDVLRRCGRTFYAASKILPKRVRRDLATLYAFCRVVDDCADLAQNQPDAEHTTDELIAVITACLEGTSDRSPIVASFRDLALEKDVPLVHAKELITGVRSDLDHVRVETESELIRYAYRVASTVGLMMCRILNVPEKGDPFAIDLGIGMQLTNIARDVAEDARNDRVYVPSDWVDHDELIGVTRGDTDAGRLRRSVSAVERLLALADEYYESAELGMHFLPARVRGGIRSAAWNYRAIGARVRKDPAHALRSRVHTSDLSKALRSGVAAWQSLLESLPLGPDDAHKAELHIPLASLRLSQGG
ncbi:MAG: phytoene/squalene synthase family protein [Planctomycetota bacterium]